MKNARILELDQSITDADERIPVSLFNPEGQRTPMLFVRSWFGELVAYQCLAASLGPDQPVYTIAPPQGNSLAEYPESVDEWAEWAGEKVEGLQGDVILGGNSFGGVLALHLSSLLDSTAINPLQVVLIDTSLPRKSNFKPSSRVHWFTHNLNKLVELPPGERSAHVKAGWHRRRARFDTTKKPAPVKVHKTENVVTSTGLKMPLLQRAIWVTYLKYKPRVWNTPVSLFWTSQSQEKAGDSLLGWSPWLIGPIQVNPIKGDHHTIMAPQYVEALAGHLAALEMRLFTKILEAPDKSRDIQSGGNKTRYEVDTDKISGDMEATHGDKYL